MAALQGLSGLYPDPQDTTDYMDEGVLEARAAPGTPVSDHGEYGSQYNGYSGTIPTESPFSPMSVYDGWSGSNEFINAALAPGFDRSGEEDDKTPTTHSSPYPRGIIQMSWDDPDAAARVGTQLETLHGTDLGGPFFYNWNSPAGHEEETHYTTDRYDAPNDNYLSPEIPGQIKTGNNSGTGGGGKASGGGSNADTTQGYGQLNSLPEFQMGHSIRRVQHDTVHFDYTNTHGEQNVPFMGRHPIEQMPLDGPDSPYFEMGNIDGANTPWEGRIGDPSPYEQPAEPTIGPALVSNDVWAY
jgi:hypothetical protein